MVKLFSLDENTNFNQIKKNNRFRPMFCLPKVAVRLNDYF